jgi:predicted DNA-binding protein YlxM (UPF0122 family)
MAPLTSKKLCQKRFVVQLNNISLHVFQPEDVMAKPDWEAIETAYRAGMMSLREIASQHGISEGAIRKRAKRDDWSRDLAAKVKERADDLVRKAEVRKQVRTETTLSERVLIEATAEGLRRYAWSTAAISARPTDNECPV